MSTLNATNLKNPSSVSNNIVLDSAGRVLVGAASNNTQFGSSVQIVGTSSDATQLWQRSTTGTGGPELYLAKSRGTASSPTVVAADDAVGLIDFRGYSGAGANYVQAASIQAFVDGTPDSAGDTTDMPGRLVFSTTADGAGTPTEQMRLDSAGNLRFNSGYGSVATAYGCRAWVNFNGTGTVAIRANGNVSSITDNGIGDYTVNFTTAMVDANYCWTTSGQRGDGAGTVGFTGAYGTAANAYTSATTSGLRVLTASAAGAALDYVAVTVAIFR